MSAPRWALDGLAAMQVEREIAATRIESLDLTIAQLTKIYNVPAAPTEQKTAPTPRRKKAGPKPRQVGADSSEAQARRDAVLQAIGRSEVGLSIGELRRQTPKMDGVDRSNALQQLKQLGKIRRAGNSWVKVEQD